MPVTFSTLNPQATLFGQLLAEPAWWTALKAHPQLYIEIRKDNQIVVYYRGSNVARLHFCSKHRELQVFVHRKYLGLDTSAPMYVQCGPTIGKEMQSILLRVRDLNAQKTSAKADYVLGSLDRHLDTDFSIKDGAEEFSATAVEVLGGTLTFLQRRPNAQFIKKHAADLLDYYQRVYGIKKQLGLPLPHSFPQRVSESPLPYAF